MKPLRSTLACLLLVLSVTSCTNTYLDQDQKHTIQELKTELQQEGITKLPKGSIEKEWGDLETLLEHVVLGNPDAEHMLGLVLLIENQDSRNFNRTIHWLEKAAYQNNRKAQKTLYHIYSSKEEYQNIDRALMWLEIAAEEDPEAQYVFGGLYDIGGIVPRDFKKAVIWYRKAADQGHTKAEYSMGAMYSVGFGVEQDLDQSIIWYEKAAIKGNHRAQARLVHQYLEKGNHERAYYWLEQVSSEHKDGDAYSFLGYIYEQGKFGEADLDKALYYYKKAVLLGEKSAESDMKRLLKQRKEAQKSAELTP